MVPVTPSSKHPCTQILQYQDSVRHLLSLYDVLRFISRYASSRVSFFVSCLNCSERCLDPGLLTYTRTAPALRNGLVTDRGNASTLELSTTVELPHLLRALHELPPQSRYLTSRNPYKVKMAVRTEISCSTFIRASDCPAHRHHPGTAVSGMVYSQLLRCERMWEFRKQR